MKNNLSHEETIQLYSYLNAPDYDLLKRVMLMNIGELHIKLENAKEEDIVNIQAEIKAIRKMLKIKECFRVSNVSGKPIVDL